MKDISILRIEQDKLDFASIVNVEKKLYDLIGKGVKAILIDFENIAHVDSRSVVVLVGFNIQCNNKNVIMGLFNLCEDVKYVFRVTNVDSVLRIYATEEEAVNNVNELLTK